MNNFNQFIHSLINSGIDSNTDKSVAKYMITTHRLTITWIPLVLLFLIVFYSAGATFFAQTLSILLATHFLVFYLSKKKWFTLTRILEIIVPVSAVQLGCAVDFPVDMKFRSTFSMYIVAFSVLPFLLFSLKEIKPLLFTLGWIIASWLSFDYININYGTEAAPELLHSSLFSFFASTGALLLLYSSVWLFKTANQNYEETIYKLIQKTKDQNTAIIAQSETVEKQNKHLSEQHKKNVHSLNYASHIQSSVFPEEVIKQPIITDSFLLFKPRDIVSGDFYWHKEIKNKIFICVADCTGHGVPGAMTSMLAVSYLNDIINYASQANPAEILTELNRKIGNILGPKNKKGLFHHGLDIAILSIDKSGKTAEFAGAHNSLLLIRKNTLTEIRGNRSSINGNSVEAEFANIEIEIRKTDQIYLFTDGYADQLNGRYGEKIKKRTFKNLILQNKDLDLDDQKSKLLKYLSEWQAGSEQTDDILIVGIKF